MKNIFKQLLVLSLISSISIYTGIAQASDIEFEITGINSNNGKIYVQLFKGEENYKQGNANLSTIVKAAKGTTKVIFSDIKPDQYAVRFFHDENDNGEMETNFIGIPVEGYGFSNNAKPSFGPVSYHEINFIVSKSDTTVKNKTSVIY
jgi:uncharacterized protein (DUF2141 family)